mmetsp:Transcript_86213/g.248947  ORF Transcript_86213/g.248947 Transcript_86213/m.248947 type:complete len:221 (+) Transcript_86213:508-1170(+)
MISVFRTGLPNRSWSECINRLLPSSMESPGAFRFLPAVAAGIPPCPNKLAMDATPSSAATSGNSACNAAFAAPCSAARLLDAGSLFQYSAPKQAGLMREQLNVFSPSTGTTVYTKSPFANDLLKRLPIAWFNFPLKSTPSPPAVPKPSASAAIIIVGGTMLPFMPPFMPANMPPPSVTVGGLARAAGTPYICMRRLLMFTAWSHSPPSVAMGTLRSSMLS